jgi:hypothetical protein
VTGFPLLPVYGEERCQSEILRYQAKGRGKENKLCAKAPSKRSGDVSNFSLRAGRILSRFHNNVVAGKTVVENSLKQRIQYDVLLSFS